MGKEGSAVEKKRIRLEINGVVCGLITQETEEYMQALAAEVGEMMKEIQSASPFITREAAALTAALSYCDDAKKNGKRAAELSDRVEELEVEAEIWQEDQEKLSEQKESSQEHLKEMQNQNREEKAASELKENKEHREAKDKKPETDMEQLDSGCSVSGILEVMPDGFGFIRSDNYLPGENDVYVSPAQIRRFGLKTGDILSGNTRIKTQSEKFSALLYVTTVNGYHPAEAAKRPNFEELTPIFPKDRIRLEQPGSSTAMRIMDLISPIGKGQRGMIVSPPKAGKTTLLKEVALSVQKTEPDMHLLILLIDERPEEVTDIKEAIEGPNVEVIYSTFDELPEHHKRVSEMLIARAKRLVEHGRDVMILLDSITRLSRAYNLTVPPSGRTLSGGLDPAALYSPKRFFGAARKMREGGSLTILATALVETGSKMDEDVLSFPRRRSSVRVRRAFLSGRRG